MYRDDDGQMFESPFSLDLGLKTSHYAARKTSNQIQS